MKTPQAIRHAVHSKASPKVIIWDIDGTLIDTAPLPVKSLISKLQIKTSWDPDTDSRPPCDPNIRGRLQELFDLNSEQAQRMIEEFRQNNKGSTSCSPEGLYPGIERVMKKIKLMKIQQAVVTNIRRRDSTFQFCKNHSIDQFCDYFIGRDWLGKKRKANLIEEFLEHLHTRDAIMIGDTDVDKQAAEETGVRFIGVNYGYGFRDVPRYANSPEEILNCIERTNN